MGGGRMKAVSACLGVLTAASLLGTAALAAPPAVPAQAKPAAPAIHRMTSLLAYEPAWLPDSKRLAFLGNRQPGEASHVYVWEPQAGKLARASTLMAKRHSLTISEAGLLAYVEHREAPQQLAPAGGDATQPQPGPDTLVVQDLATTTTQAVLTDGWVQPRSVAWSPDGKRLAFITLDRSGQQRLAIVTPGQPVALVQLGAAYEFQGLVGWANAREVVLRGSALVSGAPAAEQLLVVGREGVQAYRPAIGPKLSPDGRWLLSRATDAGGISLRLVTGGGRLLNGTASAFDWAPKADHLYATIDRDVVALDLRGKVLKRWAGLATMALGTVVVAPDGKHVACIADYHLAAVSVK